MYAIFVDYAKDGTQTPLRVQELKKDATYGGPSFPYSAWVPKTEFEAPGNTKVTLHPNSTYSDGTGRRHPRVEVGRRPRRRRGTLNQICNQAPTDLVQCYAGTGSAGYDGAATGQGLAFIHSFATSNGTPAAASSARREAHQHGVHRRRPAGEPLGPVLRERRQRLHRRRHREGGLRPADPPANGDPTRKPNQGGFCAERLWRSRGRARAGHLDVDRDHDGSRGGGPHMLTLSWQDKTGAELQQPQQPEPSARPPWRTRRTTIPARSATSSSRRRGRTARPPAPRGAGVADANSTARGNYCYSVNVGLDQPLALKPWNSPSIVLRFGEQGGPQGRKRDRQPQRLAPLRLGPDAGGHVLERLLHDLWPELRQVGHVDHAGVHPGREVLEGRQVRRVPAEQPAACQLRQQPASDLHRGQERPGAGLPGGHLQPLRGSR